MTICPFELRLAVSMKPGERVEMEAERARNPYRPCCGFPWAWVRDIVGDLRLVDVVDVRIGNYSQFIHKQPLSLQWLLDVAASPIYGPAMFEPVLAEGVFRWQFHNTSAEPVSFTLHLPCLMHVPD